MEHLSAQHFVTPASSSDFNVTAPSTRRDDWCILVLPFLECQPLYDNFNHNKPITDASNATPRSVQIGVMLCPSDSHNSRPFMGEQGTSTAGYGDNWARGNYAANADLGFAIRYVGSLYAGGEEFPGWKDDTLRGVMGYNCAITHARMRDGASNTVLFGRDTCGSDALRHSRRLGVGRSGLQRTVGPRLSLRGRCLRPESGGASGRRRVQLRPHSSGFWRS